MKELLYVPVILLLLATAPGADAQSLPEGPSQKLVELVCSKCHSTDRIASKRMTRAEWKEEVTEMLQEEDDVTEAEKDEIIDYLAKNFPAKADDDKAKAKEKAVVIVPCRLQKSGAQALNNRALCNQDTVPRPQIARIEALVLPGQSSRRRCRS